MKLLGFPLLALAAVAGAQTPLSPLWTRPGVNHIQQINVDLAHSRVLLITQGQLTVFSRTTGAVIWHLRTDGEAAADFSPDGSMVLLSSEGFRPRIYDAATGAPLRHVTNDFNVFGRSFWVPATATSPAIPAGADVFVSGFGFFRSSDGAQLSSQTHLSGNEESVFTPDGSYLSTGAGVAFSDSDNNQSAAAGNAPSQVGADGSYWVTYADPDDALVFPLPAADGSHPIWDIAYSSGFRPDRMQRLGNTKRFVVLGHETVGDQTIIAYVVLDAGTGRILDHRRTPYPFDTGFEPFVPLRTEGDSGFVYASNNPGTADFYRVVEVPVDATGRTGTPVVLLEASPNTYHLDGGLNDSGIVAVGSSQTGTVDLVNGTTGLLTRHIARPVDRFSPYFAFSPSGHYLYFQSNGSLETASVPAGSIANESPDYVPTTLFPLLDDTLLGTASTPEGSSIDVRLTRSAGTYHTFRSYPGAPTMIGASQDGSTFLAADSQLHLYSVATGGQIGFTGWDSPADLTSDNVQTAVEGDGFVVVAKRVVDEGANRIYLDIRRYARQGNVLALLSNPVRRAYVLVKNEGSAKIRFEIRFRLSPDGRMVWASAQRDEGTSDASIKAEWLGEAIRTADGGVLGQFNDPTYDFGVHATAIDPLNRQGYLSRWDGDVQGVPLPNAFASILSSASEIVGGNAASAIFRLLRAGSATASYTAVASGVTLDHTNLDFTAGVRDLTIPFSSSPVNTATDATIKVTDSFGTVSTKVHLVPPHLLSAGFVMASVHGGDPIDLDLTLDGLAASQGRTITLSDNSSALLTPLSATVPAGAKTVRVNIVSKKVTKATVVTVTARLDGKAVTAKVTLNP